jgi:hypothetical protein
LKEVSDGESRTRRSKEVRLNDLKYELMVLNQDLSRVVPTSKLSEELLSKRSVLQERISSLEQELSEKPMVKADSQSSKTDIKKVQDEEGNVRIWSSSQTHA